MKIDRLLSIIIMLLNRDRISARELAEHFEVSVRTIQRDMDSLTYAGIPIVASLGVQGGFGIMKGYKLDRQLVDTDDLFFILTALKSIGTAFRNDKITFTLEKIKTLIHDFQAREIDRRKDNLHIDFSAISLSQSGSLLYNKLDNAIEESRLIQFKYTDSNCKVSERSLEPMTIAFKWFSWYLFGYCRLREDYRIFRLSRMQDVNVMADCFQRRDLTFQEFEKRSFEKKMEEVVLRFNPEMKFMVKEYFNDGKAEIAKDGSLIIHTELPDNEGLIYMILAWGDTVEVLEPNHLRKSIQEKCQTICEKYSSNTL
ncbi:YafY family transcriptional regulator [candidate division KSB1 bacterium]|nr:YafY family transcriptional regulator [candidate division KSB1 bacterium]